MKQPLTLVTLLVLVGCAPKVTLTLGGTQLPDEGVVLAQVNTTPVFATGQVKDGKVNLGELDWDAFTNVGVPIEEYAAKSCGDGTPAETQRPDERYTLVNLFYGPQKQRLQATGDPPEAGTHLLLSNSQASLSTDLKCTSGLQVQVKLAIEKGINVVSCQFTNSNARFVCNNHPDPKAVVWEPEKQDWSSLKPAKEKNL